MQNDADEITPLMSIYLAVHRGLFPFACDCKKHVCVCVGLCVWNVCMRVCVCVCVFGFVCVFVVYHKLKHYI